MGGRPRHLTRILASMETFDERAATWDDDDKVARAQQSAANIVRHVHLKGSERFFEYGAGTGLVTQALAAHVGAITVADTSQGMRDQLQQKIDDGRLKEARVWNLDLASDPIPEGEFFDLIVTSMVLHHIAAPVEVLRKFGSMLTSDGHLCVIDLDAEDGSFHGDGVNVHHGFERSSLEVILRDAGFDSVHIVDDGVVTHGDDRYSLFLAIANK